MIEYKNVSKSYNGKKIIENFNLKIDCNEFLTVIGTSGSGKTTILKMINGLVTPDEGEVLVFGENIMEVDLIKFRRNIGYVIQGNILFPHLNIFENIAYVLRLQNIPQKEIEERVFEKLEMMGLNRDIKDRYPNELSGGQQQRVGIARGLIANPKILLMDEPFGAVDAITRNQLQKELKELHKKNNISIVFVTHDITEALKLGTKVLVMDRGEIQQYATPEEIVNNNKNEFVRELIEMVKI